MDKEKVNGNAAYEDRDKRLDLKHTFSTRYTSSILYNKLKRDQVLSGMPKEKSASTRPSRY